MNVKNNKQMLAACVVSALVLLPSCAVLDYFKGKQSDEGAASSVEVQEMVAVLPGEVVVTMNGNPAITSGTLEAEKENIFKSNPQVKAALAFMNPKDLDRNLTDGLVSQMVVDEEVRARGLDQSSEYKSELADAYKAIKRMLNAKYFGQTFKVAVSDAEALKFYEANKDTIPGLLISQGGVVASGIQFEDEDAAKDFASRVKAAGNDFRKVAQQEGIENTITDFRMVNSQSVGIDPALRDKITAIKTVPSVDVIVAGGAVWVINATAKETAKHRPFEQIKEGIKQELEKNKRGELFEVEIKKLKDKYNVVIDEDYFKSPAMPGEMEQQEANAESMKARGSSTADAVDKERAPKRLA